MFRVKLVPRGEWDHMMNRVKLLVGVNTERNNVHHVNPAKPCFPLPIAYCIYFVFSLTISSTLQVYNIFLLFPPNRGGPGGSHWLPHRPIDFEASP